MAPGQLEREHVRRHLALSFGVKLGTPLNALFGSEGGLI